MARTNEHPNTKQRRKAKLSPLIIRAIRSTSYPRKFWAEKLGVGEYTIRDIRQYRTWAWVD